MNLNSLPHADPYGPDREAALAQYGQRAATYDADLFAFVFVATAIRR